MEWNRKWSVNLVKIRPKAWGKERERQNENENEKKHLIKINDCNFNEPCTSKSRRAVFHNPGMVRVLIQRHCCQRRPHFVLSYFAATDAVHRLYSIHLYDFHRLRAMFRAVELWFLRHCHRSLPYNRRLHWKTAEMSLLQHSNTDNRVRLNHSNRLHQLHPFRRQSLNSLFSLALSIDRLRFHAFCDATVMAAAFCGQPFVAIDTRQLLFHHYYSHETGRRPHPIMNIEFPSYQIGPNPNLWPW